MNAKSFMKKAGLFVPGLFAFILSALGITAWAQPSHPQDPLSQTMWIAALEGRVETVRSSLDQGAAPDTADPDGLDDGVLQRAHGNGEAVA